MSLCSKKREREKMKNSLRLGSGSELCVAAQCFSVVLCCTVMTVSVSG